MRRTNKGELNLNKHLIDLNKSSNGCVPCLSKATIIAKEVNGRSLNEIKIEEIKKIVSSIFQSKK